MKIGILTHFHKSTNYGGVLQAYALCKYLNNCGHTAQQIRYNDSKISLGASTVSGRNFFKILCSKINRTVNKKRNALIRKRKKLRFSEFRSNIPHTEREYSKNDIADVADEFDAFIVGSDQVWNPFWYDSSYFLDFIGTEKIKISYAASMGVDSLNQEQAAIYKKHLMQFKNISVREKTMVDILSPIVEKKAVMSVDPTLLLNVNEWDEIASQRKIKENYVFLYLLGDNNKTRKIAEEFAKKRGLKLVIIPDLQGIYRKIDRKIQAQILEDVTPNDFISLIKYADYIITDSFHACVFSFLYKKDFFVFNRADRIAMESRIDSITGLFECTERFCKSSNKDTLNYILTSSPMNYQKNFDTFNRMKQSSMDFLSDNFGKMENLNCDKSIIRKGDKRYGEK